MSIEKIKDNVGLPSFMVRIPKFKVSDVIPGGRDETYPAFIVDGKELPEIFISQYQNIIVKGKAYSLPFQQPAVNINYDDARQACESKGRGWHLMTNAEWAAIALWCKAHGTMPHGNNHQGSDYRNKSESGFCFDGYKTLTGSGPESWSHDGTAEGIFDLNGNVWEWVGGLRLLNGEIQIIPNNDAATHIDQSAESKVWEPILSGKKSVKYRESDSGIALTGEDKAEGWNGCRFENLVAKIEVPDLLKELALYPAEKSGISDYFWADAEGERLPIRGGGWAGGSGAGVFGLVLGDARSDAGGSLGFRSAFVNL